jgi:5-methylcytosine-specific restriction protein A
VIAVCPNCHRRAHHASDSDAFNEQLKQKVQAAEQPWAAPARVRERQ